MMRPRSKLEIFQGYCWGFYGPREIYGDMFNHALTRDALDAACTLHMVTMGDRFCGDSFDRECVREFLTLAFDRTRLAKLAIG